MELDLTLGTLAVLKSEARELRSARESAGTPITHAEALECVAHNHGARDWNTLRARAARPVRLAPGMALAGRYLGQPFTGRVHGIELVGTPDRLRVSLHLDEPVDVVTFDSFSSWRQRVTAVVGRDGRSMQHTSNGVPHLVLESAQV